MTFPLVPLRTYERRPYHFQVFRQKFLLMPGIIDIQGQNWVIHCYEGDEKFREVTEMATTTNKEAEDRCLIQIVGRLWAEGRIDQPAPVRTPPNKG